MSSCVGYSRRNAARGSPFRNAPNSRGKRTVAHHARGAPVAAVSPLDSIPRIDYYPRYPSFALRGAVMTRPGSGPGAVRRQCAPRMERQGGAAGLASRRAPSQGARAARSQGLPKGASQAPGAHRKSGLPDLRTKYARSRASPRSGALHSLFGGEEKGSRPTPGLQATGAAERWLFSASS